jgi:hypothetical protein
MDLKKDVTNIQGQEAVDVLNAAQQNYDDTKAMLNEPKNTASGAEAALGTQFSWDQKATGVADTKFQMEANQAKSDALAQRQTLEQNAANYQTQADMMKYSSNQSAQSAGWTGGYVLDQNRQMEYLKSSIQAQMYGAMELQKYGYDTALTAARLSYDLNQQEFAHQYYMDAVNASLQEASTTGVYISPEVKDMLAQYNTAQGELKADPTNEKATKVSNAVKDWFSQQGITNMSEPGIKTLSAIQYEIDLAYNEMMNAYTQYYEVLDRIAAADSVAAQKLAENANAFIKYEVDENGNVVEKYNPTTGKYEIGDFSSMSAEEIKKMAESNDKSKQQVISYVDSTFQEIINNYVSSVQLKDASGNTVYNIKAEELEAKLKNNATATEIKDILSGYSYSTLAGNKEVEISVDSNGEIKISVEKDVTASSKPTHTTGGATSSEVEQAITESGLTASEKQDALSLAQNASNRYLSDVRVNEDGDTFTNNSGNRGDGNNFSLLIGDTKYRVQNGPQVKYGSVLDTLLNSYSTAVGATAVVDGILYARDNECWYVVEGRSNSFEEDWNALRESYGLSDYIDAPVSEYYTYDKQKGRK